MGSKTYLEKTVLKAARERISLVFDHFDRVCVSCSGGKDSTVLLHLAREEALRRDRVVDVLFIDLEVQYQMTIEHVHTLASMDGTRWHWMCLPLNLRNGVSQFQPHWCCWNPEKESEWFRELPDRERVVSDPDALPFFSHRMEFETFVVEWPRWKAEQEHNGDITWASLVGNRADESLRRYASVADKAKKSAVEFDGQTLPWSSVDHKTRHPNIVSFFPIYDWGFSDVWKFIGENDLLYNELYDKMHLAGISTTDMRICQPYGDDQRKGLDLWQKVEPSTWGAVIDRVTGVNYGSKYAESHLMGYRSVELPDQHTWRSYTFFLLSTLPDVMRERYLSNFAVFLEWWMRNGYKKLNIHQDERAPLKKSDRRNLPSWRRMAKAILKNDFNCKTLSISAVKDVWGDVYEPVMNGEPVNVRKSVEPIYDYLREQYRLYEKEGIAAVELDFEDAKEHLDETHPIKEKYANL
jgi:predicted phosphoadenosine phosphosulfate sulfurtransferase